MSVVFDRARISRKPAAFFMALMGALALMASIVVSVSPAAHAQDNRGNLRPGCTWDGAMYFVQRCIVHSNAMDRDMTVQIQAANGGGNAGLYLLDGMRAPDFGSDWINQGKAHETLIDDNITKVYPVGGESSFYTDWNEPATSASGTKIYKWETFLTSELPGYLEQNFGVSRTNNAIGGISMGGTAAMNLAEHHPEMFRQVSSFSGYLHTSTPLMNMLIRGAMNDVGGYNIDQMWGPMLSPRTLENDPWVNSPRLAGKQIFISASGGIWNLQDNFFADPIASLSGIVLEMTSRMSTVEFEGKIRVEGQNPQTYYPAVGVHNWRNWADALVQAKPQIEGALGA